MMRGALAASLAFVAACAVVHGSGRYVGPPPGAQPGEHHLRLLYAVDLGHPWQAAPDRDELFWRAADVVQKRARALFEDAEVRRTSDDEIEVWLPSGTEEQFAAFRRIARTPGRFRVAVVDHDSPFMQAFARRPPGDLPFEVTIGRDSWTLPSSGPKREDIYFAARDAEALAHAIAILLSATPLPADREILIERGPESARTYFVISSGGLDNTAIQSADVRPGWQGRPEVQLTLTPDGQRQFEALTARMVGRKLAIAIDGSVSVAPVVVERIANGWIHLGGGYVDPALDPGEAKEALDDLAAVLRSGPLPAPITLRSEDREYARFRLR